MRWKWILGTFVVVILGLIVAAYVIISTYDFNRCHGQEIDPGGQY